MFDAILVLLRLILALSKCVLDCFEESLGYIFQDFLEDFTVILALLAQSASNPMSLIDA